jgi:hypothetical protein
MPDFMPRFSVVRSLMALVAVLVVSYIGLIAFVMSYAAVETDTAQSVRDESAQVSTLEVEYLDRSAALSIVDPSSLGYVTPRAKSFVAGPAQAALVGDGQ